MKHILWILMFAVCCAALAQHDHAADAKPATLMSGFGDLQHPVTTSNPEAQQFFDQGLRLIYAFNHDESARSFRRAAELDPQMPMAYWGIAEAVGPNYNDPASDDRFAAAHDAIAKAAALSAKASPAERAYIAAMAKRFPADPKADRRKSAEEYRDAMRELVKHDPDDLDAATLFAESSMNLHPWGLWHHDGTPEAGTEEIVSTLESVIKRDPNHMGAVHYYIHAVEASNSPERALAGANHLAALAPAAGHLVHMPAHVYIRTGDFDAAERTNVDAAKADEAYIAAGGPPGMYSMMYYSHNLHFIAASAGMSGRYADASQAADKLAAHVAPFVKDVPPLEGFMAVPIVTRVRFQKWDEIMAMPAPDASMQGATVIWHFARGMALAAKGKVAEAEAEHKLVAKAEHDTPPDQIFAMPVNNKTKDVLKIAVNMLGAKVALARNDSSAAISMLRTAVETQDALKYDEPPDWLIPAREMLGATLLKTGNAVEAEKVFREDLLHNPRNPRSLFGLREALKSQKRDYDAQFVDKQFQNAWRGSDTTLTIDSLV